MNKYLNIKFFYISLLLIFFITNTQTTFKSISLGITVLILSGKNFKKLIDSNLLLLILFLMIYFIISSYNAYEKSEVNNQLLIVPPILYIFCKWGGYKYYNPSQISKLFWIIGLSLSLLALLSVYIDIIQNGFLGGGRSLTLIGVGQEIHATGLAGMLIVPIAYSGVLLASDQRFYLHEKIILIIFFLLSLLAAIRVGSRTFLIIAAISFLQGMYINSKKSGIKITLLISLIFLMSGYYLFDFLSNTLDIFSYYQSRMDSEEHGLQTAGGRSEKWLKSLSLMASNPMGWDFQINGFSHNLWLDTARNGGLISFTILIFLTIKLITSINISLKIFSTNSFYRTSVTCVFTAYFILFSIEPILDGYVYVFCSFCCLWGLVEGCKKRTASNLKRSTCHAVR